MFNDCSFEMRLRLYVETPRAAVHWSYFIFYSFIICTDEATKGATTIKFNLTPRKHRVCTFGGCCICWCVSTCMPTWISCREYVWKSVGCEGKILWKFFSQIGFKIKFSVGFTLYSHPSIYTVLFSGQIFYFIKIFIWLIHSYYTNLFVLKEIRLLCVMRLNKLKNH